MKLIGYMIVATILGLTALFGGLVLAGIVLTYI